MKIPATVCLVYRPLATQTLLTGEVVKLHETYPSYHESPNRMKSARSWAGHKSQEQDFPNLFDKLRVISLEERGEGGRAYKVLLDNLYLIDLREDVLMELMLHKGIQVGGYVEAAFRFALNGSQFKLYWEESTEYKHVQAQEIIEAAKVVVGKVAAKDLVYGQTYKDHNNNVLVFLGRVRTTKFDQFVKNHAEITAYNNAQNERFQVAYEKAMKKEGINESAYAADRFPIALLGDLFGFAKGLKGDLEPRDRRGTDTYRHDAPPPITELRPTSKPAVYQLWVNIWSLPLVITEEDMQRRVCHKLFFQKTYSVYLDNKPAPTFPFNSTEKLVTSIQQAAENGVFAHIFDEFDYLRQATVVV